MKQFLLIALFAFSFLSAQTHRFIYEVQYKKDSTETLITKDFYHLDVNKDESIYYDRTFFISDSIQKLGNGFPAPKMNPIFIKKNGSKIFDKYEFLGWDIIKTQSEPKQVWKLSSEKKQFQNYTLQKATTDWGGRKWTAWFAPEIPIPKGPYKFQDLPGLIAEISDDKGNFDFKLIKSENYPETQTIGIFSNMTSRAILFSDEKYKKLKLAFYEDPLMYVKNGQVDLSKTEALILEDGTHVTQKNVREVTAVQKKMIKKYNNPIELDEAIPYPKN